MSDPDITTTWTLRRGSQTNRSRFHLTAEVNAEFVEPTRDEVRTALAQILDEALGTVPVDADAEIAGWQPLNGGELIVGTWAADPVAPELDALLAWKAEALELLGTLDRCHALLPPGYQAELGTSKADAVFRYLHATVD